jgi:hypothetical protein
MWGCWLPPTSEKEMTNLEQEAEAACMMVAAGGKRAFVLIAEAQGNHVSVTRAISEGVTKREGVAWIGALNRERARVGKLLGLDPDDIQFAPAE